MYMYIIICSVCVCVLCIFMRLSRVPLGESSAEHLGELWSPSHSELLYVAGGGGGGGQGN